MHPSSTQLDSFVAGQPHARFLQSSGWKEFQGALGRTVTVLARGEPHPSASALCIETRAPFGFRYWFCPRGPVMADANIATSFLTQMSAEASRAGAIFLRAEPTHAPDPRLGWRPSRPIHPKDTLLMDLSQTESTLLQTMKPKTRYNIRLAEKRGVKIETTTEDASIEIFFSLLTETGQRQHIRSYEKSYYQTLLRVLGSHDPVDHQHLSCRIITGRMKDQIIAANLMLFYGDTVTYLFGGSSHAHRSVMAPALLQWHAIKVAKALGYRWYDFWGIAPVNHTASHPWAGVSRFKQGFGGTALIYSGAYDLPLAPFQYQAYRLMRMLRHSSS